MMKVELQKEHHWLRKLIGTWKSEHVIPAEPGQEPQTMTWTETFRSLEGVWFVGEASGTMPDGSSASSILTIGFDPARKRFVGSWIGSMMANLWIYDGELDASERILTLNSEGPAFDNPGHTTKFKDIIEFKSDDERIFTGVILDKDGNWSEMMSAPYLRVK